MFVVFLRFSSNKAQAAKYIGGHKEWLEAGFADHVFLMAGSLAGGAGGVILVHHLNMGALKARLANDPFVAYGVVEPEVVEISPKRTVASLSSLLETSA